MDPELIDLLWEVHNELGSAEPINIISGFRSRDTNEMLRRTVGGQASQSRHILGKAADVTFPDVPVKKLRYSALIRERGGVGYYPTSAMPFVHMDTDRVRAWPRLPRTELALLFPNGRTQHVPDDGGPITQGGRASGARRQLRSWRQQIAAFHDLRARAKAPIQVASLGTVAAATAGAAAAGGAAGRARHASERTGSRHAGGAGRPSRCRSSCRRRRRSAARVPAAASTGRDAGLGGRSRRPARHGSPEAGSLAQPRRHVRAGAGL